LTFYDNYISHTKHYNVAIGGVAHTNYLMIYCMSKKGK